MSAPVFAIVGRVNRGKSSVIATLSEDDTVPIAPEPGTTTRCRSYPVVVDGELLFTVVGTPGFEQASRALAWLREQETSADSRPAAVASFLERFGSGDDFPEECRLLKPIVEGASVLYVVDGSRPYRPNHEAEMEILRWAGRPGMALINRIGTDDHAEVWRRALDQYFKVVRDFDAQKAGFEDRVALLRTFRELRDEWAEPLDRAVTALEKDRTRRRDEAVGEISALLVDMLTMRLEVPASGAAGVRAQRTRLEARFHDLLRARETASRERVNAIYGHGRVRWREEAVHRAAFDDDLFDPQNLKRLGQPPGRLLAAYTAAGGAVGGVVTAGSGGVDLGSGALVGAVSGFVLGVSRLGERLVQGRLKADGQWSVGPIRHPNFPWVALDRALLHLEAVSNRAHARQDDPRLEEREGFAHSLPKHLFTALNDVFARIRKRPGDVPVACRQELERRVAEVVERFAPEA